jgi:hypothetical protein
MVKSKRVRWGENVTKRGNLECIQNFREKTLCEIRDVICEDGTGSRSFPVAGLDISSVENV